jgi:hypothetical protein
MPTPWPGPSMFSEAIQNPSFCFKDSEMRTATVVSDMLGLPFASTGQFAVVFKVSVNGGPAAVRCFTRSLGDLEDRYQLINDYLNQASRVAPALLNRFVRFEFDKEGILVRGKWYPILQMEWVNGNTLDVALEQLVASNSTGEILALAQDFSRLAFDLQGSCIGHGDLQHGNILVLSDLSLKLVDLDGMFVPPMKGRRAAELGHRDYQHPRREEFFFDERVDNFSVLVIYLSLRALAEDPALWNSFRKESLIFSQEDFRNPSTSKIFATLRKKQGEIKTLVDALERACHKKPEECPALSALILSAPPPASSLPSWMRPDSSHIAITTRAAGSPAISKPSVRISAPVSSPSTFNPSTTAASPVKGSVGGLRGQSNLVAACYAGTVSFGFLAVTNSVFSLVYFYGMVACLLVGIALRQTSGAPSVAGRIFSIPRSPSGAQSQPTTYMPAAAQPASSSGSTALFVGNRTRMTFHRASCEWARKVSVRNKVTFASATDAKNKGYRPCRLCKP